jgi:YD repeat-containing protein
VFDAFGNRTSMTDSSGTATYSYDDADRLTSVTPPSPDPVVSYTWDDNGNLTNRGSDSFTWDYEDRMTTATVGGINSSYTYRGDGLRDSRTVGMGTTFSPGTSPLVSRSSSTMGSSTSPAPAS